MSLKHAWLIAAGLLFMLCPAVQAQEIKYTTYVMDHDYFSCEIPADWGFDRDAEGDEEYRIYEITIPVPGPMSDINLRCLLKDNEDFSGYQDFLNRNSRNVLGETKNSRESYGPVTKIKLAGRDAFSLRRDRTVFLHPESKSDESAAISEIIYVLPMEDGSFYVLHYRAAADRFQEFLPVFEHVAASFKPGKP